MTVCLEARPGLSFSRPPPQNPTLKDLVLNNKPRMCRQGTFALYVFVCVYAGPLLK